MADGRVMFLVSDPNRNRVIQEEGVKRAGFMRTVTRSPEFDGVEKGIGRVDRASLAVVSIRNISDGYIAILSAPYIACPDGPGRPVLLKSAPSGKQRGGQRTGG